jgi:hypothetical protein
VPVLTLPYPADGVAVWENTLYVSCKKGGCIFVCDPQLRPAHHSVSGPGIGIENLSIWGDYLWVCDQVEQTVYCLDRATGEVVVKMLTPFANPTGLAVPPHTTPEGGTIWVAYTNEEPYIRDDPNGEDPYELTLRDRTLIHPPHLSLVQRGQLLPHQRLPGRDDLRRRNRHPRRCPSPQRY